jgi:membrane associated rhomboid family serine protease
MSYTLTRATNTPFQKYLPAVTITCCVTSIVLFIGINLESEIDNWDVYKKWGAPASTDIFNGDLWGLITSNFLHVEIWHIAFNLYWFWIFGKKVEFENSKLFYGLFILSSALVSSLSQLAFSDSTGIGLSGIGYALFGFLYLKSKTDETYKGYLDKKTINLFIFWLALCVILTKTGAWTVGNAAHIGGLLWGITIAYVSKFKKNLQLSIRFLYITILVALIFYGPFSTSFLTYRAYKLHENQKVDEAIIVYKKILKVEPNNEWAKENLKQLELRQLEEKALEFHQKQNYSEARKLYNQILNIDKNNEWAKDNLSRLPTQ